MKNKIAIIGSGLTSLAAAKRLIENNFDVTILDVGKELPKGINDLVKEASQTEPILWKKRTREKLSQNPTVEEKKIPKKLLYGSDYMYSDELDFLNDKNKKIDAASTYAKGGYSKIWGAAMLPADIKDLDTWPVKTRNLDKHYKRVLQEMPLTGEDGDSEIFPNHKNKLSTLRISPKSNYLYNKLKQNISKKNNFSCIKSRLAIYGDDYKKGCKYCGLCLNGCPYDLIFNSSIEFDNLIKKRKLKYINNAFVNSYIEENDFVKVFYKNLKTNSMVQMQFNKIFIAAGAIGSTLLFLKSNKIHNKKIKFLDSQKYVFPIFSLRKFNININDSNTLCDIFIDFKIRKISNFWNHIQVSDLNDWITGKLGLNNFKSIKFKLFKPILERLSIGWGGLHSKLSKNFFLVLSEDSSYKLLDEKNLFTKLHIIKVLFFLLFKNLKNKVIFLPYFISSNIGGGCHYGGSIPMKTKPKNAFEADMLGRPYNHKNVHIIDATILPSIPSTTIALLTMANADRIICKTFDFRV